MPTLSEIIREKHARLNTVPDNFITAVDKNNAKIFEEILRLLEALEVKSGKIVVSARNLELSQQIVNRLEVVIFDGEYMTALTEFAKQFNVQAGINNQYFEKEFKEFKKVFAVPSNADLFKTALTQSQKSAIELLAQGGVQQQFSNPLKDLINAGITGNASLVETIKSVNSFIIGTNERGGALTINAKQVSHDGFAFSDRQYTKAISEQLGIEWFKYDGGVIEDSRPFCEQYHGQYFHAMEVADFGDGIDLDGSPLTKAELQGRYPQTNRATIFTFAGGFNCRHNWLPVSIASVPKEVIQRNIAKGYYTS